MPGVPGHTNASGGALLAAAPPSDGRTKVRAMPARPARDERLARVYDSEVYPLLAQRRDRQLESLLDRVLAATPLKAGAQVLHVGAGSGAFASRLLTRLPSDVRVVILDSSSALLELARERLTREHPGRKLFFRTQPATQRLSFANGSFDLLVGALALEEMDSRAVFWKDVARIMKKPAPMVLSLLAQGTWGELLDVLAEVFQAGEAPNPDRVRALADYRARYPEPETLAREAEAIGRGAVTVELDRWELLFRSAREFLYAPLIEHGPLDGWKELAGKGAAVADTFVKVKQSIDTYYARRPFAVTIEAVGLALAGAS